MASMIHDDGVMVSLKDYFHGIDLDVDPLIIMGHCCAGLGLRVCDKIISWPQ